MDKKNLFQKINNVMREVKTVEKTASIIMVRGSYNAVEHDEVTSLLHGPMVKEGIVANATMESCELSVLDNNGRPSYRTDVWVSVTFINADNPDEFMVTKSFSYALDMGDKATGKAYSMAVKYCYLKTFMLASCDKEENRDFEQSSPQRPSGNAQGFTKNSASGASDAQKNFIFKMLNQKHNGQIPALVLDGIKKLSSSVASEKIKELKAELGIQ
jgi:hypothetical protein